MAVTVVLPFRNAAATLPACLDSIAAQDCAAYELLAVDDHSSDASPTLVRERARGDTRIRVIRSPGRGLVAALNAGLDQARAPVIARMDADDLMHPQRLRRQLEYLASEPTTVVLGTRVRLFPEHAIRSGYREYVRWQNGCLTAQTIRDEIYVESPFAHPSVALRRDPVIAAGGYRDGPFPEDYELWLRLHHRGATMCKLPEVLLDWRESDGRASRTDPRYAREAFDALRAEYLSRDARFLCRRDDFVIWGAGRKTRRRTRHLLDRGFRPRAWVDIDPRKIGNRLEEVPVVGPDWLGQAERPFVLGYVANHGAREDIAGYLDRAGYAPGADYLMVG